MEESGPLSPEEIGRKRRHIWLDVPKGILFTILLILLKMPLERTDPGERLRLGTYDFLQHRLSVTRNSDDLPVVIVDTTEIGQMPVDGRNSTQTATPRNKLRDLITKVAQYQPRALGVDVDFSPDTSGYITPDDPAFFEFCQTLRKEKNLPVFLGIERTVALEPEYWLGSQDYEQLAASLVIPREHARLMLRWTHMAEAPKPCETLSAALAGVAREPGFEPPAWLRWAVEWTQEQQPAPELDVQGFLVDYSPLERLAAERIPARDLMRGNSPKSSLRGKVVLFGDATVGRTSDNFIVPDRSAPAPGVFLHACAIYTLLRAPLYELTLPGRLLADMLLVACIIGALTVIRLRYVMVDEKTIPLARIQTLLTWGVILLAFVGGVMFVNVTRVMWDDFLLVSLGLLIHHPFEQGIEYLLEKVQHKFRRHPEQSQESTSEEETE